MSTLSKDASPMTKDRHLACIISRRRASQSTRARAAFIDSALVRSGSQHG
jgi:hypothetical protein